MAIDTEERNPVHPGKSGGKASNSNKKALIIVLSVIGGLIALAIIAWVLIALVFFKAAHDLTDHVSVSGKDGNSELTIKGDDDSKATVSSDGNKSSVTVKGKDGETTFKTGSSLPSDFPSSVPLYKGSTVASSSSSSTDGGKSYVVSLDSSDSVQQVSDFYQQALAANGWTTDGTYSADGTDMYSASNRSEKLTLSVNVSTDSSNNGKTEILITVSPKTD